MRWGGMHTDRGKTGYHGYWGVNFFELDEHLPSEGLDFAGLTTGLKAHGLKTVLDIVTNHVGQAFYYDINGNGQADIQTFGGGKPGNPPATPRLRRGPSGRPRSGRSSRRSRPGTSAKPALT